MEPVTTMTESSGGLDVEDSLEAALRRKLIRLENRERKPAVYDPARRTEADVLRSLLENGIWVRPVKDAESGEREE
ncbi:hypothetical protein ACFPVX_04690 [Cohnella faecalis]|uniref:Uncharacterized protein n=1 Tax=Cohnella faecalis TaxID=2315694 RepID=A0A398CVN2_9BACL|nr:hypothetical protein [Cohnella faecalis]RIE03927.1 hypothetical protein D3H35_08155 [Cohnella faecalis]